jgi:hypothetical protein
MQMECQCVCNVIIHQEQNLVISWSDFILLHINQQQIEWKWCSSIEYNLFGYQYQGSLICVFKGSPLQHIAPHFRVCRHRFYTVSHSQCSSRIFTSVNKNKKPYCWVSDIRASCVCFPPPPKKKINIKGGKKESLWNHLALLVCVCVCVCVCVYVCVCVCVCVSIKHLNKLPDFHKTRYEYNANEGHHNAGIINFLKLVIAERRKYKLVRWVWLYCHLLWGKSKMITWRP